MENSSKKSVVMPLKKADWKEKTDSIFPLEDNFVQKKYRSFFFVFTAIFLFSPVTGKAFIDQNFSDTPLFVLNLSGRKFPVFVDTGRG